MVSSLACQTGHLIDSQVPEQWRWQSKPVRLIDGTTLSMPDTLDNQTAYPQLKGQKAGLGFPICRLVGVICLSSGQCKGKGTSEQDFLRSMLDTFNAGDFMLGDAFFGAIFAVIVA